MKLLRPLRWLLLALAVALLPAAAARAEVIISVGFAPPPLLVYEQPPCPDQGLIWVPGYWAYGPYGYYWVPGAWVPAPFEGALWTPGYWGWDGGMYYWHPGYWGYNVGYYGGINYGYGYFGIGFVGGRWNGGFFEYNTAVWHVDRDRIHRFYDDRDWHGHYVNRDSRVAFNGGPGGIRHDPDAREREYMHEQHFERTRFQTQHIEAARNDHNAYFNVNHGRPAKIVTTRPLARETRPLPVQRNTFNNQHPNQPRNGARNTYQEPKTGGTNPFYNEHNQQARPQQPQNRTQPEYRQVPPQIQRQQQNRPQQRQPEYRPQPQNRPQQPEYRPQPQQQRPQQPQYRPQPEQRPQQPEYRPQPQNRPQPEYRPAPQQRPEYRPQPQERQRPESRPQPQQRPENRGNGGRPEDHAHGR